MPRIASEKVARQLAERMITRGHEGSLEWLTAWCRRWGSEVAKATATNPLFLHEKQGGFFVVGTDRVPIDLYREWKDLQDGTRTIRGTVEGAVFWKD